MFADTFYLIRSRQDGQYLVARPRRADQPQSDDAPPPAGFVLLFGEHADALSYLNAHAREYADRFAVESIPKTQLASLLKRWGFEGCGIVTDPLLPKVEFLLRERGLP
ncbi:hypothetical protein [Leptolyngbya ohadii]|uniref:hypothetical protein n=1 Tax=Leptolyngbya ohadii TaxID=1962290 RepID=UPI000B59AE8B|nr:hypothetical protein [Leptolyngbya ohadii]